KPPTTSYGITASSMTSAASTGSVRKCVLSCSAACRNIRCNRSKPLLRRLRASPASSPPDTAYIDQIWHTYGIIKRFIPEEVPSLQNARQQQGGVHFDLINRVHVPIAFGSMSFVLVLLANAVVRGRFDEPARLAATVTVALLA